MSKDKELPVAFAEKTLNAITKDVHDLMSKYKDVNDKFICGVQYYEIITEALIKGCFRVSDSINNKEERNNANHETFSVLQEMIVEAANEAGMNIRVLDESFFSGSDDKVLH